MNKPIKVIKRRPAPAEEIEATPEAAEASAPTPRQAERQLHETVNQWIEERRRNGEVETGIANARLRASRA